MGRRNSRWWNDNLVRRKIRDIIFVIFHFRRNFQVFTEFFEGCSDFSFSVDENHEARHYESNSGLIIWKKETQASKTKRKTFLWNLQKRTIQFA
jgi:hypothetical protein